MAGKVRHLLERGGRYSARVAVPAALRETLGKRELLRALGPDRVLALRKLPGAVADMQAELEAARTHMKASKTARQPMRRGKPLSAQQIAQQHYRDQIAFDEEMRHADSRYAQGFVDEFYVDDLKRAASGAASNDELRAVLGRIVDRFHQHGHTTAQPGDTEFRKVAMALAVAELESLKVSVARDEGDSVAATAHPLLVKEQPELSRAPTSPRILGPQSTQPLSELISMLAEEKGARPGTINEYRIAARMFEEFMGEARAAYAITRQDIIGYKRALMETPANYTKRFPNKTLPEAIKINNARVAPFPALSSKTINDKWLTHLRAILNWCVRNDVIPDNPASGVKVEQVKATSAARLHFSPGDLSKIFAPPLFGSAKDYGERQWMLLTALFTGFRASEIAQLRLDSIRHERRILVFAVEEETKNQASKRLTPVHSTLLRLGLEGLVAKLRSAGETHLFPEWFKAAQSMLAAEDGRDVNQPYSQFLPRWFNRTYLPKVGIHDERKVFHSFRHTLKTALARAGVPRSTSDEITGHDDRTSGARYVHETSVEAMKEALEKIHFDGFNL